MIKRGPSLSRLPPNANTPRCPCCGGVAYGKPGNRCGACGINCKRRDDGTWQPGDACPSMRGARIEAARTRYQESAKREEAGRAAARASGAPGPAVALPREPTNLFRF